MKQTYYNRWIPDKAREILDAEKGAILDVGGGASPYAAAAHIIDQLPFPGEALMAANAWGKRETDIKWSPKQYTRIDLNEEKKWPFDDKQFDLGLCSHTLEDLRNPFSVVKELSRVCKRILIIVPSRLLEQTRGIDDYAYCGFPYHFWIIYTQDKKLIFRRKTMFVMSPKCHIVCPIGSTLKVKYGSTFFNEEGLEAEERILYYREDKEDYMQFIMPFRKRKDIFEPIKDFNYMRNILSIMTS